MLSAAPRADGLRGIAPHQRRTGLSAAVGHGIGASGRHSGAAEHETGSLVFAQHPSAGKIWTHCSRVLEPLGGKGGGSKDFARGGAALPTANRRSLWPRNRSDRLFRAAFQVARLVGKFLFVAEIAVASSLQQSEMILISGLQRTHQYFKFGHAAQITKTMVIDEKWPARESGANASFQPFERRRWPIKQCENASDLIISMMRMTERFWNSACPVDALYSLSDLPVSVKDA